MDKLLLFPGRTDKGIFTYVIDAEKNYLEKTAAEYHPTIASYINSAKPIKGKTQILLTALGAGEWWGCNVNGDYFPEIALAHEGDKYGYKTFEHYAKVFKHHVNKDPKAAYGDISLAVYNPVFHRAELIVALDNSRAPDIAQRIDNGEYPDVSMGCVRATAPILMFDFSLKLISEIEKGDKVLNGNGTSSIVSYAHSHHHKGYWYYISVKGIPEEHMEPTTEEHPWYILPKEQVRCYGNPNNKGYKARLCVPGRERKSTCKDCPNAVSEYRPVWKRADEIEVGDYVATPILKGISDAPEDRMAYLLGLYLAQGSISADEYIRLDVNSSHTAHYEKIRSLYPELSTTWNGRDNSENAAFIGIYDKVLARELCRLAGKGAHTKKLHQDVMTWPMESQKIFLGGYLDGDGGVYNNNCYFSTCNFVLANQIKTILLRCGCVATVNPILHKPSTIVKKETLEYQIWVGQDYSRYLKGYSFKTKDLEPVKKITTHRFISQGYLWSPVTSIHIEECNEEVYNMAVDSLDFHTDSYQINNIALHNCKVPWDECSICGNRAPTRVHYCDHLKYYIGRIDPVTGKQVYAINWYPKFFDISFVLIGADRIAKTLRKVAFVPGNYPILSSAYLAEKMAEKKQAEIEKEIPPDQPPASTDSLAKARTLADSITEVKSMEPPLPRRVVDDLAGNPLPKVLSTMTMMGIIPKPQEFQRIYLISVNKKPLADDLDRRNLCFDPMSVEEPSDEQIRSVDLGAHNFDNSLAQKLMPFMADRSYAAPHLGRRIVIMIKKGEAGPLPRFIKVSAEEAERKPLSPVAALVAAAGAYAALIHMAPKETLKGIDKILSSSAGIGMATALGLGLIKTFNTVVGPNRRGQFSPENSSTNPDTSDVFARIEALKQKPLHKVGSESLPFSMGSAAKRLFLGVPLAYMASGVLQKHKELSPYDNEGRIRSFVRRNPDIVSAGLIADAMLSAKGHTFSSRNLFAKAKNLVKAGSADYGYNRSAALADNLYGTEFSKLADAQDFLSSSVIWPLAMGKHNLPGRVVGGLFDQAVLESGAKLLERRQAAKQKKLESSQGSLKHLKEH